MTAPALGRGDAGHARPARARSGLRSRRDRRFGGAAIGPDGAITFADSNVRAIALAELNAAANGLTNFNAVASHALTDWPDASFDVVLANPPYYAQGSIIHLFIDRSKALLRPGGALYLVTKQVDLAWPMIQERFGEPEAY